MNGGRLLELRVLEDLDGIGPLGMAPEHGLQVDPEAAAAKHPTQANFRLSKSAAAVGIFSTVPRSFNAQRRLESSRSSPRCSESTRTAS